MISSAEVFGQPEVKARSETSRFTGETVTLRKGASFRRRATGGVDVIDIATGRTNITVECVCDSDLANFSFTLKPGNLNSGSRGLTLKAFANSSPGFALKPWV